MNSYNVNQLFNSIEKSMVAIGKYDIGEIENSYNELLKDASSVAGFKSSERLSNWEKTTEISKAVKNLSKLQASLLKDCLSQVEAMPNSIYKLINKAVIFDYLHEDVAIWNLLNELYNLFQQNLIADYRILWECGNLCYKLNRYDESIEYYEKYVIVTKDIFGLDDWTVYNHIGQACIKIGYCYEFKHEFSKAIYIYSLIKNDISPTIKDAVSADFVNEITTVMSGVVYERLSRDNKNDIEHGLGHFYNEIVLFPENEEFLNKINDVKKDFLYKANHIFYRIACEKGNYYSCLGTNHSEYNEFLEAVQIIDFAIDAGIYNYGTTKIKNQHLIQRLNFYKAHAYMYCGEFKEAHACFDSFEAYCNEYDDNDGYAHLAIYKAYLLMLEKGLNNLSYLDIEAALKKLEKYKPSLYSNIQMIEEREMLIHVLNSLLLVKMLLSDEDIEDTLISMTNPIISLPIELHNSLKSMEKNSGRELFENGKIRNADRGTDTKVFQINYLGVSIFWVGKLPDNVTTYTEITEKYFLKNLYKRYLVINDNIQDISIINQNSNAISSCKGILVSGEYSITIRNTFPNVRFMNCDKKVLLQYAYILAAYGLVCEAFLEQKPFLGMSPTKITQNYVYRPRMYLGLYYGDFEMSFSDYFEESINIFNKEFDKHTQIANTINNPEGSLKFIKCIDMLITNDPLNSYVSGIIFQPGLVESASRRSIWMYKFYGSEIIIDNSRDKNQFYKRFRNVIKTKIPYSNTIYSEFPGFEINKKREHVIKCQDCNKNVRKIKGEYAYYSYEDEQWKNVLDFFENDILKNILFINYSCDDIKELVCIHTDSGAADPSEGYLFIALKNKLSSDQLNSLISLSLKAYCRTYFKCEESASEEEPKTTNTQNDNKEDLEGEQVDIISSELQKMIES